MAGPEITRQVPHAKAARVGPTSPVRRVPAAGEPTLGAQALAKGALQDAQPGAGAAASELAEAICRPVVPRYAREEGFPEVCATPIRAIADVGPSLATKVGGAAVAAEPVGEAIPRLAASPDVGTGQAAVEVQVPSKRGQTGVVWPAVPGVHAAAREAVPLVRGAHDAEAAVVALVDVAGGAAASGRVAAGAWPDAGETTVAGTAMKGLGAFSAVRTRAEEAAVITSVSCRFLSVLVAVTAVGRNEPPCLVTLTVVTLVLHVLQPKGVTTLDATL